MTFTWNSSLLSGTGTTASMHKVRILVGDTNSDDPQLDDEVIYYVLTVQSVLTYASAACADMIAAKYAREVNITVGETRVTKERIYYHYKDLAERLRAAGPGDRLT